MIYFRWEKVAYFFHPRESGYRYKSWRFLVKKESLVGINTFRDSLIGRVAQAMFIGEYTHTLDPKKRLALPSKFRKELGRKAVVTKGLDNCLFVYPIKQWEKVAENFSKLSMAKSDARALNRHMLSGAFEIEIDSAGRVLIPEVLKEFASLERDASVLGVSDRIEIWNPKKWSEYKKKIDKQADQLAEKLGEAGVI